MMEVRKSAHCRQDLEVMCLGLGMHEPTHGLYCSSSSTIVPLLLLAAFIAGLGPFVAWLLFL